MNETWPFLAHLISSFSWPERGAQEAERRGIRCLALLARRRFRKLSKTILQPLSLPIEFETRYEHDRPTSGGCSEINPKLVAFNIHLDPQVEVHSGVDDGRLLGGVDPQGGQDVLDIRGLERR